MSDIYELLPGYQKLAQQCSALGIELEPEPGELALYQGQSHRVIGEYGGQLVMLATPVLPPIDAESLVRVDGWAENSEFVYMPGVSSLIEMVRSVSSMFPTITPGVQTTREVWQIKHPDIEPVVANSLEEALLQSAIQILDGKLSQQ